MANNTNNNTSARQITIRHRGRGAQVSIYFGKMLRMFVYQNDWKVLPMAALIAGLVGMVVRNRFFINMEGTLMGAFAMVCVCIWNGCFNSIQVISRERDVIKREHRSGMHISSYIVSHMLYQALLCLAQTAVTLYVTQLVGVQYPWEGLITPFFAVDFMISMFLITFASDMLSLWVSTLAHDTTTAMTIMPFVLIFQLVFSGGMITLPAWTEPLTHFTISNPGLKVLAAQADTNHRPYATISTMVSKMRSSEIGFDFTVGQALDLMQDEGNPTVAKLREKELGGVITLGEVQDAIESSALFADLKEEHILEDLTIGDILRVIAEADGLDSVRNFNIGITNELTVGDMIQTMLTDEAFTPLLEKKLVRTTTVGEVLDAMNLTEVLAQYRDTSIDATITVGEVVDLIAADPDIQARRDDQISFHTTVGSLLDLVGEDRVKSFLEEKAAQASYIADYDCTRENIMNYWLSLALFALAFAALAMITLEFIDKDKR